MEVDVKTVRNVLIVLLTRSTPYIIVHREEGTSYLFFPLDLRVTVTCTVTVFFLYCHVRKVIYDF